MLCLFIIVSFIGFWNVLSTQSTDKKKGYLYIKTSILG